MSQLQPVRGTRDLIFGECQKLRHVEETAARVVSLYGFEEIETPIVERAALFKRGLGATSDIVSKEMYEFKDLGGDDLVLRPEGTAGVARAFISEGLSQQLPLKLFYRGPMFRYERPQKGRYRQFYQMGVELLGVDKPQADAETIACAMHVLKSLDLEGELRLALNTIGDDESRGAFRDKLVAYLKTRESELSKESLARLERNPLRILDSKDEGDRRVVAEAPTLASCLNDTSRKFFDQVKEGLTKLGIGYEVDPRLVRGLDYYCHTVVEFQTANLGAQNAVGGGGRYDQLISDLGGPATPGFGWALGVDRLMLLLKDTLKSLAPIALIPLGEEAEGAALEIAQDLRAQGVKVDLGFSGNLGKRMKRADKIGARAAVILGSNELAAGVAQVKTLATGEQREVKLTDLAREFSASKT